jgi:hypothetical protein
MNVRIRDIALPEEKAAVLSFIDGSQRYEHEVEPNRRLDGAVAAEHFALLSERMATNRGRMFVAELDRRVVGWAVFFVRSSEPTAISPNSSLRSFREATALAAPSLPPARRKRGGSAWDTS